MNVRYKYLISVHAKRQTFQYVNHSVSEKSKIHVTGHKYWFKEDSIRNTHA
jgi:hypothetical protein